MTIPSQPRQCFVAHFAVRRKGKKYIKEANEADKTHKNKWVQAVETELMYSYILLSVYFFNQNEVWNSQAIRRRQNATAWSKTTSLSWGFSRPFCFLFQKKQIILSMNIYSLRNSFPHKIYIKLFLIVPFAACRNLAEWTHPGKKGLCCQQGFWYVSAPSVLVNRLLDCVAGSRPRGAQAATWSV